MNSDYEESDVSTVTLEWSYAGIHTDTEESTAATPIVANGIMGQPAPTPTNYDDPLGGVHGSSTRRRLWEEDADAGADADDELTYADIVAMADIEAGAAPKPIAPYHQYQAENWEGAAMFDGGDSQDTPRLVLGREQMLHVHESLDTSELQPQPHPHPQPQPQPQPRRPLQVETENHVSPALQEKRALKSQKEKAAYNLLFQTYAKQPLPPGEQEEGVEARFTPSASPYVQTWQDRDIDDDISSIGNSVKSYQLRITPKFEAMTTAMTTRIPNTPPSKPNTPIPKVSQPNARRDAPPDILNTGTGSTDLMQYSGDKNHNTENDTEPNEGHSYRRSRLWIAAVCLSLVILVASIVGLSLTLIWLRSNDNGNSNGNNDSANSTSLDSPQFVYPNATSIPSSSPTLGPSTTNTTTTNDSTDPPLVSVPADLLEWIELVSPNSLSSLGDSDTPQFQAFEWLASDPDYIGYSPNRIIQRWALAVFFFSSVQESNTRRVLTESSVSCNSNWMSYTNECSWHSTYPLDVCNQDGMLKVVHLVDSGLEGTIPSELALLSNSLERIYLSFNNLTGTIPPELGQLTRLERLQLTTNDLTGTIPSTIGNLTDLLVLGLGHNQLRGALPSDLGNLESLRTLGLEGNQITGTIPREFAGMINIRSFVLESNQLNGTIPFEFGELSQLSSLSVHQNDLTGAMPLSLCPVPGSSVTSLKADCDEIMCDCCTDCCIGCFAFSRPTKSPTAAPSGAIRSLRPTISVSESTPRPTVPVSIGNTPGPTGSIPVATPRPTISNPLGTTMPTISNPLGTTMPTISAGMLGTVSPTISPISTPGPTISIPVATPTPTFSPVENSPPPTPPVLPLTISPTTYPTSRPTISSPVATSRPTFSPVENSPPPTPLVLPLTVSPTTYPTPRPTISSPVATPRPTFSPVGNSPTPTPSVVPLTMGPTAYPSTVPSSPPSFSESISPSTIPSEAPSGLPSVLSTGAPSLSVLPTTSVVPSGTPSLSSNPTLSIMPSDLPSIMPSIGPSLAPSSSPTICVVSISTDKVCFGREETIQVTFENCNPAASDWVAIRDTNYASPLRISYFRYEALWVRPCGSQTCKNPVRSGNVTFDKSLAVGGDPAYQWPLPKGRYKLYLIHGLFPYAESAEIHVDEKKCKEP